MYIYTHIYLNYRRDVFLSPIQGIKYRNNTKDFNPYYYTVFIVQYF